ncbi:serine/threonine protein kinase [bacterium]|nr:serine/threonine protein kinase [bacterium]
MKRVWLSLLLAGAAGAQQVRVVELRTRPAVQVYLDGQPVPQEGGKMTLHKTNFQDAAGRTVARTLTLNDFDGEYQEEKRSVEWSDLADNCYPPGAQPPLQLRLKSPVLYFVRHYPGVVTLLGLVVSGLLWRFWQKKRYERAFVVYARNLAEQKASGDDQNIGRHIGPYQLTRLLGRGGFGGVYEAFPIGDPFTKSAVAIKLMNYQGDAEIRKREEREVKALTRLNHPHVLRLLHLIETGPDQVALVLEVIRGRSLERFLGEQPALSQRLAWMDQLLQAVSYCHQNDVMHRDLKPPNVMIDEKGKAILVDFGLAKGENATLLTRPDEAVGSPDYMAPEQLQGQASPASDQWALGVIAYEMLAGRRPFQGPEIMQIFYEIMQLDPPALPAEVKPQLAAVIGKMLAKDPKERYPSVAHAHDSWQKAVAS